MDKFHIAIVGVGAMGTRFGAMLQQIADAHSLKITLIGSWAEQITALNNGLSVTDEQGNESNVRLTATANWRHAPQADIAIVLVKSWQTATVAAKIAHFLKPDGIAVTLQNGLGNDAILAETFGETRVFRGITAMGANLVAPGKLRFGGNGRTLIERKHPSPERLQLLVGALNAAGIPTEYCDEIELPIWEKLAVNAAINPLTALHNIPNGELLARPDLLAQMELIVREVVEVANARGIKLSFPETWQNVQSVCRQTGQNISSMLQDVRNRRRTEIDAINGMIVKYGRESGIAVPENTVVWQHVKNHVETIHESSPTKTGQRIGDSNKGDS